MNNEIFELIQVIINNPHILDNLNYDELETILSMFNGGM